MPRIWLHAALEQGRGTMDDDSSFGEAQLFAYLIHLMATGLLHGGRDELRADIAFAEVLFFHHHYPMPSAV